MKSYFFRIIFSAIIVIMLASIMPPSISAEASYQEIPLSKNELNFDSTLQGSLITTTPIVKSLKSSLPSGQPVNSKITLTANVTGGTSPYTYQFSYTTGSTEIPVPSSDVSGNIATITLSQIGIYRFYVTATDSKNVQSKKFALSSYRVVDTISVKTLSLDKSSPLNIGSRIKLTATGQNGKTPYQYQFYYKLDNGTSVPIGSFSRTSSVSFTPPIPGTYIFYAEIKDGTGKISDQKNSFPITITNYPVVKKITAELPSKQVLGTPIKISAEVTAGTGSYTYQFFYKKGTVSETSIPESSISGNTALFIPPETGIYTFSVKVIDSAGNQSNTSVLKNYNIIPAASVRTLSISPKSPQALGTTLQLRASATDGKPPYQYQFYYQLNNDVPVSIGTFSKSSAVNFKPTAAGTYTFYAEVKDSTNKVSYQKRSNPFTVTNNFSITKFFSDLPSGQSVNTPIKLITTLEGGSGSYTSQFSYKIDDGPENPIPDSNVSGNAATFTPSETGTYTFYVNVTDSPSNPPETATISNYLVVAKPTIASLSCDKPSPQVADSTLSLTAAEVTGGKTPYRYQFYYQLNGSARLKISQPITSATVHFTPVDPGTYTFSVEMTDDNQTVSNQCSLNSYVITAPTETSTGRVLISNESTDIETLQSTGTIHPSVDTMSTAEPTGLEPDAYELNPTPPFEFKEENLLPAQGEGLEIMATPTLNSTKLFHVYDFVSKNYDNTTTARLAYIGEHVQVWVESKNPTAVITNEMAKSIGQEFDNNIYELVRDSFYTESDVNGDGKVAILCYDIQGGYPPGTSGYTIGGYFTGNDLENYANSNKMELLYADTWPNLGEDNNNPDISRMYPTLAHEFQHLVNFNGTVLDSDTPNPMASWLDEGFSEAAEQIYNGTQTGRIAYYNSSNDIRNGQSLLDWNGGLASYSLSYLFSQYLRTQVEQSTNGTELKIFNEMINDQSSETEVVTHVIQKYIDPEMTLGEFLTNFRMALLLRESSGKYGFNGEFGFNAIKTPLYSGGTTNLGGGGAVVKSVSLPFTVPTDKGLNINYVTIAKP